MNEEIVSGNTTAAEPRGKTLHQTAIILNVSEKTVRRYIKTGKLRWTETKKVSIDSITEELNREK